jgi:hypothetical protein
VKTIKEACHALTRVLTTMDAFFQNELNQIPGQKIVTYWSFYHTGNFDMLDRKVTSTTYTRLRKVMSPIFESGVATVVVRRFTKEIHEPTKFPIKYVRMYLIQQGIISRVSVEDVKEAMSRDSFTGELFEPDDSVIYE